MNGGLVMPNSGNPYAGNAATVIKDSGDRTQFDTGAVRDMRVGKGRFDLVPIEVMYQCLKRAGQEDRVLNAVYGFKVREYENVNWLYMALEAFCSIAYDFSYPTMFLEVAKHFEAGAIKYGENNWQKGIPPHVYIDSALRHYMKWLRKDTDEPHDRAFVWNIMCCIWEVEFHKEAAE